MKWWQNKTKLGDIAAKDYLLSSLSRVHTFFPQQHNNRYISAVSSIDSREPNKTFAWRKNNFNQFLEKDNAYTTTTQQWATLNLIFEIVQFVICPTLKKPTLTEKNPFLFCSQPNYTDKKGCGFLLFPLTRVGLFPQRMAHYIFAFFLLIFYFFLYSFLSFLNVNGAKAH